MSAAEEKKHIIVTGGSGYIAGHIIRELLARGHSVTAVVRDVQQKEKYQHLLALPQQPGQLKFAESDIQEAKYEEIFKGADGVIHTATPYIYSAADPEKEIVKPAVAGTEAAIHAALKAGVKRVVVTSSGGAIMHFPVPNGYVFSDKDWNEWSNLQNNPYFYSKRLAEQAAWRLYEENKERVEVVVVNPLFVVGPTQSAILNTSLKTVRAHLTGEAKTILPGRVGWVDVRDVATAHVIAVLHPEAVGKRLICCGDTRSWKEMNQKLKELFPQFPVTQDDSVPDPSPWSMDTAPLKALGFGEFRSFEVMLRDTVASMIDVGAVSAPQ